MRKIFLSLAVAAFSFLAMGETANAQSNTVNYELQLNKEVSVLEVQQMNLEQMLQLFPQNQRNHFAGTLQGKSQVYREDATDLLRRVIVKYLENK